MSPYDTVIFGITRATGRSSPEKKTSISVSDKNKLKLKIGGLLSSVIHV